MPSFCFYLVFVRVCVDHNVELLPPSCKLQSIESSTFGTTGPLPVLHRPVTAVFDSHRILKPSTLTRPLLPSFPLLPPLQTVVATGCVCTLHMLYMLFNGMHRTTASKNENMSQPSWTIRVCFVPSHPLLWVQRSSWLSRPAVHNRLNAVYSIYYTLLFLNMIWTGRFDRRNAGRSVPCTVWYTTACSKTAGNTEHCPLRLTLHCSFTANIVTAV